MRKLTSTLCLTLAVLLGVTGVSYAVPDCPIGTLLTFENKEMGECVSANAETRMGPSSTSTETDKAPPIKNADKPIQEPFECSKKYPNFPNLDNPVINRCPKRTLEDMKRGKCVSTSAETKSVPPTDSDIQISSFKSIKDDDDINIFTFGKRIRNLKLKSFYWINDKKRYYEQGDGLNIKIDNKIFNICFPYKNHPRALLIHRRIFREIPLSTYSKQIMFSVMTTVNCGSGCSYTYVYEIGFEPKKRDFMLFGETVSEWNSPSFWFTNKLPLNHAKTLWNQYGDPFHWRGSLYCSTEDPKENFYKKCEENW